MCKKKDANKEKIIPKLLNLASRIIKDLSPAQKINFFGGVVGSILVYNLLSESWIRTLILEAVHGYTNTTEPMPNYLKFAYVLMVFVYFFFCAIKADKNHT